MAQRRYGPTRGAGTAIIEQEGEKQIEASALGWCAWGGILEKGPTDEMIVCQNKTEFLQKCGSYIDDSYLPDCAFDYYKVANGAGGLLLQRITDGNEVQASKKLYARKADEVVKRIEMGTIKAHNGGKWGGQYLRGFGTFTGAGDLTATTIKNVGTSWAKNTLVGGHVQLTGIANSNYLIVSNDPSVDGGTITVTAESTISTDFSGTDYGFYVLLENSGKAVSFKIEDGENNPDTEFAISVFVDGNFFKKYPNLNTNPTSPNYWVNVINNDSSNYAIQAINSWTNDHTPDVRPANEWGKIKTVTSTVITKEISEIKHTVGDLDSTLTLGTVTEIMLPQTITLSWTSATEATAVSDKFGALGTVTLGSAFTPSPANKWCPGFTIVAGGTAPENGDVSVIYFEPFIPSSLVGGYIYPDKANAKLEKYRITANTTSTITIGVGDLTTSGAIGDYFLVEYNEELEGGHDGHGTVSDTDYLNGHLSISSSLFNRTEDKGYGLVKIATPGVNSTAVQKAGAAYAEAKNHQYRYEFPSGTTTEVAAMTYINDTLGRNDFVAAAFPSYYSGIDPADTGAGKWKDIPLTGLIHGREARIAANYDGYHKAQAGVDAILPGVLAITTGEKVLNEELLNPQGIAVIKKKKGNYVLWGDRNPSVDPTWKWKHQREQMSYYEHVLQENFDWINFMINDPITQPLALVALQSFFKPEWRPKRAIRGNEFEDAARIKVDNEINTDATRAAGDMFSEISLRLADTVERFIIKIGKQGIFESVA
jgi:hypothetical protein